MKRIKEYLVPFEKFAREIPFVITKGDRQEDIIKRNNSADGSLATLQLRTI